MSIGSVASQLYTIQIREKVPLGTAFTMLVREDLAMRFSVYNIAKIITKSDLIASALQAVYGKKTPLQKKEEEREKRKEEQEQLFKRFTLSSITGLRKQVNALANVSKRNTELISGIYNELGAFRSQRRMNVNSFKGGAMRVPVANKTIKGQLQQINKDLEELRNSGKLKRGRPEPRGKRKNKKETESALGLDLSSLATNLVMSIVGKPALLAMIAGGALRSIGLGSLALRGLAVTQLPGAISRTSDRLTGKSTDTNLIDSAVMGVGGYTAASIAMRATSMIKQRSAAKTASAARLRERAFYRGVKGNARGFDKYYEAKLNRESAEKTPQAIKQLKKMKFIGPMLEKAAKSATGIGRFGGAATVGIVAYTVSQMGNANANLAANRISRSQYKRDMIKYYDNLIDSLGPTALGAAIGGLAGTAMFPGVGTIGGAAVGAQVGGILGVLDYIRGLFFEKPEENSTFFAEKIYELLHEDKSVQLTKSNRNPARDPRRGGGGGGDGGGGGGGGGVPFRRGGGGGRGGNDDLVSGEEFGVYSNYDIAKGGKMPEGKYALDPFSGKWFQPGDKLPNGLVLTDGLHGPGTPGVILQEDFNPYSPTFNRVIYKVTYDDKDVYSYDMSRELVRKFGASFLHHGPRHATFFQVPDDPNSKGYVPGQKIPMVNYPVPQSPPGGVSAAGELRPNFPIFGVSPLVTKIGPNKYAFGNYGGAADTTAQFKSLYSSEDFKNWAERSYGKETADRLFVASKADQMVGTDENDPLIREFIENGGFNWKAGINGTEVEAWCAKYVNTILQEKGFTPALNSSGQPTAIATDFLKYGEEITNPLLVKPGDIVIETNNKSPGQVGGHVGIAQSELINGRVIIVAGNVNDKIARYSIPVDADVQVRRYGEKQRVKDKPVASTTIPRATTVIPFDSFSPTYVAATQPNQTAPIDMAAQIQSQAALIGVTAVQEQVTMIASNFNNRLNREELSKPKIQPEVDSGFSRRFNNGMNFA